MRGAPALISEVSCQSQGQSLTGSRYLISAEVDSISLTFTGQPALGEAIRERFRGRILAALKWKKPSQRPGRRVGAYGLSVELPAGWTGGRSSTPEIEYEWTRRGAVKVLFSHVVRGAERARAWSNKRLELLRRAAPDLQIASLEEVEVGSRRGTKVTWEGTLEGLPLHMTTYLFPAGAEWVLVEFHSIGRFGLREEAEAVERTLRESE